MLFRYAIICLMALLVLFVIHLLIITFNGAELSSAFDTDNVRSSSTKSGLYSSSSDKVAILSVDNFNINVYNSKSAWVVQFYNSWCGHCIKFAPVWKRLAADIYNWNRVVILGAIDCADDQNTQHCRDYEIMGYPTIRYFAPFIVNFTIGDTFVHARDDVDLLHRAILGQLEKTQQRRTGGVVDSSPNWPRLTPLENVATLWSDGAATNVNTLLLVVENGTSFVGRDLIMDTFGVRDDIVANRLIDDGRIVPEIKVYSRNGQFEGNSIAISFDNRKTIYDSIRVFLRQFGIDIPNIFAANRTEQERRIVVKQSLKQQLLINTVFQTDLDTALSYSLFHEVPLQPVIENEKMTSLVSYLRVLNKYFPFETDTQIFLSNVIDALVQLDTITGAQFRALLLKHSSRFDSESKGWISCRGSTPTYRGYPCGLWMMFHTLSMKKYGSSSDNDPTEVLHAVAGYITYFFGCQDCAEHFKEMSKTIDGNVTSSKLATLWLWRAHNSVNKRLAGDGSEDPSFPKVQFPLRSVCPACRNNDDDESWNEANVLTYLTKMYTNVHRVSSDEAANIMQARENVSWNRSDKNWPFNLSDVSTCIALYVLCACLLTIYTVKFFMKRSPRGRHYKYDFSSKV